MFNIKQNLFDIMIQKNYISSLYNKDLNARIQYKHKI